MKHFILLMTSLFILATFESCGGDKAPSGDLVTVQLVDGYQGACANELLSMHVHITVHHYSTNGVYEGVYWEDEYDTNNNQYFFYEIAIPSSGSFEVSMTLESNDCSSCCYGSCWGGEGKPSYSVESGMLTTPANGNTYLIQPYFISCN